ncbi:hypothetical protein SEUBUCD646_0O03220 [Saccharomyces eubayanus]|uniref:GYF domain-containing protein n=1 Tax=Saccharomyces eubayanus TaxID=1080349 RepID=A0ABN8VHP4_SACEU|nr:hypothetical protein SEUBUCD650_0O03220 [Saccharomyces eubayanus]CAI1767683.1 hypothetical protein SEUBUCD646_0O03220 [Saccharomyces eubayanus]
MEYMQSSNFLKLKRKTNQVVSDEELDDELYNKTKRHRGSEVKMAEYDSDSSVEDSSDDENGEKELNMKANVKNEKESEDMFLSDVDDVGAQGHKKHEKSKIQLLDIAEFRKENLVDLDITVDNGKVQEEEKIVDIEPFNIDDEVQHGVFDKDGNYIKAEDNADDEPQDNEEWMNDVIDAEQANRLERKQNTRVQNSRHYMVHEALVIFKFFLTDDKETALEALARLNKLRKIAISKKSDSVKYIIHGIELLSDLANILENKGFNGIYEYNRKKIQDAIEEELFDDASAINNQKTKLWSFRWLNKPGQTLGQFTNYEMSYWQNTYFQNNVIVKFREELDQDENWIHVSCLKFM